jgi:hypothetical protein
MFKALKKNMWTSGFFVSKVLSPYQMFTKSFQKKFVNFDISTRRDPCVQNIKKIKICIPF